MTEHRRIAVVTGAARGIGAAIAKRLSRDGNAIAVLDLDETSCSSVVNEIVARGGEAVGVGVDIADEEQVAFAISTVVDRLGPPTILVNNAGITRDNLLFKMSVDDWDAVIRVHLRGSFLMSREIQKFMTEAKWGRIISLSSTSALGNRGQTNYAAAKAGIQGLTKTLAIELGKFGVTANAIAPGFIETDMTIETAQRMGIPFEDFKMMASREIPLGRVGQPEDVAAMVSFFASEESGFISGQVIYVAGGPRS